MHISLSTRYSLKRPPANYRGQIGEHVTYAKNAPLSFSDLSKMVLADILDWYSIYDTADNMRAERDSLVEWLQSIKIEDNNAQEPG